MAAAPDGSLWFTDLSTSVPRVGRVDPATGASTLYELPTTGTVSFRNAQVTGITAGPDGAMWFTGRSSGSIGRIDASGTVTAYATGLVPVELTTGPDRAIWFTTNGGTIGRLDPATGAVASYPTPNGRNGSPVMGASSPDPTATSGSPSPARARSAASTPSRTRSPSTPPPSPTPCPAASPPPGRQTLDHRDGRQQHRERRPAVRRDARVPAAATLSAPARIISGPGGHLWFTEPGRGLIGHLDPAAPPAGTRNPAVPPTRAAARPTARPAS